MVSGRYMFDITIDIWLYIWTYIYATTIESPPKFTMTTVPFNDMREKALRYCERRLMEKMPDYGCS